VAEEVRGIQCMECGSITEGAGPNDPCEECSLGGAEDPYCTVEVVITPCPLGGSKACDDDAHHYGRGDHVTEV